MCQGFWLQLLTLEPPALLPSCLVSTSSETIRFEVLCILVGGCNGILTMQILQDFTKGQATL